MTETETERRSVGNEKDCSVMDLFFLCAFPLGLRAMEERVEVGWISLYMVCMSWNG